MKLILNGKVIWENPPDLGYFGIKLRKQLLEEAIIERSRQHVRLQQEQLAHAPKPDRCVSYISEP